jgi:virginiamycin A acetyltransferase
MVYLSKCTSNTICGNLNLKLGEGSKILDSSLSGRIALETLSTISRSNILGYLGVGCFSFLSRTSIDRYVTIGSRVSLGAFGHPTNWFSVMEFQYRSCLNTYEEEIPAKLRAKIEDPKITRIGGDVWIGDNAFIKAGITVAPGTIIGASSVVTKDTEPYLVYVGNPAKAIKARFNPSLVDRYLASEWWKILDIPQLTGVDFSNPTQAIFQVESLLDKLKH